MGKGIAIAGNLIVDYVKSIDIYPKPGMLANIKNVSHCIGGCAGNTIVDLSIIDKEIPLTCIGKVGKDDNGEYIKKLLTSNGVNIALVTISEEQVTSFTDVFNDERTGERTFFHSRGANADFCFEDIAWDKISADIFHIGYALLLDRFDQADSEYGTAMAKTLAYARKKGMKTSIDVVSENSQRFNAIVTPSLKYCTYAIMNEIEAGMVTGIEPRDDQNRVIVKNLEKICKKMLKLGVDEWVVIHMPELSCAMNCGEEFYIGKSYHLPEGYIKGSVGAGDAFCSGMLYALYNGWDMDSALKFANGSAACNLGAEDSISGMKSKDYILSLPFHINE